MKSTSLAFIAALLVVALALPASALAEPRSIHVYVALCDNENQGIVPVPAQLGNGDDPARNLYWGAAFGVKTYFQRSGEWILLTRRVAPRKPILERIILKHRSSETYLIADAYRGTAIRQAVVDFLSAAAGHKGEVINVGESSATIRAGGNADVLAYIGHNGLMDFTLSDFPGPLNNNARQAIILACASKSYFTEALRATAAAPLLWTTGLMAPEAYTLHAALEGWIRNESDAAIRKRAAEAYHRFQKCGLRAAMRLFHTGW